MYNSQVIIFDGINEAKKLDQLISNHLSVSTLTQDLAIILISNNPIAMKYVALKENIAANLGIPIRVYHYNPAKLSSLEVISKCTDVIYSPRNKSIIIQLPLPSPRLYSLLTKIPYEKDVDMLSEGHKRRFYKSDFTKLPPIVRSLDHFFQMNRLVYKDMRVLVVGKGELVGRPVAYWLEKHGSKVNTTEDYKRYNKSKLNMVIFCAGVAELGQGEDLSIGCHVIDFGYSIVDNKMVGDFDITSNISHLGVVSLSPGGMGPLVVRYLLLNHLGL